MGGQTERASEHGSGQPGTLTLARPDYAAAVRDPDDEPSAPAGRVGLASSPKLRAVYWCRFWADALRPEFYKNRPVVIVSRDNRLDGPGLVVPLTTKLQGDNKWAYKLTENPNPENPGSIVGPFATTSTPCHALSCNRWTVGPPG
jgi:mRNA-degrading endonuclease toxin of MazEF toxin-antitoxin module